MIKSCNLRFDASVPPSVCADALARAGFTHTFVMWGFSGEGVRAISAASASGLAVETVHAEYHGVNEIWQDGPVGEARAGYFRACVRGAAACGVPVVVLHLSSGDFPPAFNRLGLARYASICREAERLGVAVAFENLRKTSYLADLFANLSSPARKFCFDCGHENLYDGGFGILERYGSDLVSIHLHDNFGERDDHLLPFTGSIDFRRVAARLRPYFDANPALPLTLELKSASPDPYRFAREAFSAACRIEALIEGRA